MRILESGGVLLCVLVASACVATVSPGPSSRPDRAERVPYDEFATTVDVRAFGRLDQDDSGTVSVREWQEFDRTVEHQQDFEALDVDRNAEINPYEWQTNLGRSGVVLRVFRYLDVDRDGFVNQDEMRQSAIAAALFAVTF
jgi:hypothetical protein